MLTRSRITNPEMTDSAVLAMVLGEMQSRGLIKSPPALATVLGEMQSRGLISW